ncbi:DEAD/DEAH box helicase [Mesonia aestuariivivens]|uniref:DEAD/DEAH box helicase n=1 Tax=Mesonia aestuariivivens TaxID=2796128 RepID=A0ABS6VYT9_9FLAO|nr:DEAD/DEAH box helicase [Mesonia aestuariivivens]MBW2960755.1 DEAD/DEAH box helicase [Mesonia aestuariivivens]
MPFKKLHPEIKEKLAKLEIETPTPLQRKSIPVIKSGMNLYCTAPKGAGKTTTLILTTLQKLKCEAVGDAPRAIILVENKEKALEILDQFLVYTRHTSLRPYVAHEKMHIDLQKSEILEGIDILISTPKNLNKLFLLNGVHTSQLKIFSIDDADFLIQQTAYAALLSITQSVIKCQYVIYAEEMTAKLARYDSYFMEYSKKISLS